MLTRCKRSALLLAVAVIGCKSGPGAQPEVPGPAGQTTDGTAAGAAAGTNTPAAATGSINASAAPPTRVTAVEGITEYQLANGMRVLLFPDDSKPVVTVNVTYLVGSRHEGYGETGMAHLLEHMLFKGTPSTPDVWKALDEHGAQFNGTTWTDRTNYYETLPASDENLEFALRLEADRMVNSSIAPEVLAKEFSVVRNEFEAGENNPVAVLSERMYATAYLWHNYGKATIGSRSDIERVPVDNLRAFYQKYYQPDNAMLVVAGKFDENKALALVQQHFGSIPRPSRKLSPTYTQEPVQDGERTVMLRRAGDVGAVGLLYHTVPGAHADFVAVEALVHLLTSEPSGRLYKALVAPGHATSVWGAAYAFQDPGALELMAEVRDPRKLDMVRDIMTRTVEGLAAGKIDDAEIERYRVKARKDFKLAMTRSERIAIELSEWAALGDWRLIFVYRDRLDSLTKEHVQKVAAQYLKQANRTAGTFIPTKQPERAPLPEQPDVLALVKDYKGRDAVAAGETFEATVANVEKRTTRAQLASGMKLAFLPKETRGNAVRAELTVRFGSEKDLTGKVTAAGLVSTMLDRGTARHTYQQLEDELDRLEAQVSIGSEDVGEATITVTTVRDSLPEVLALVAEMLRTPSFPKDQFEIVRKEQLAMLEQKLQDPMEQAFVLVRRKLDPQPPGNVRYTPTTREEIERLNKVKLDEIKKLHKDLWGAGSATLAIVGDFDPAEIQPVVDKAFGTWKSARPFTRIANKYQASQASEERIDTPDKEMALIVASQTMEIRDDDPDYPALLMLNHVLGGSAASRLMNRLRQKEGLSYGAFSFAQGSSIDKIGVLIAGGILAPQNAAKGLAMMMEEIGNLAKAGIPAAELDAAKKSYMLEFATRMANDGFLASELNDGLYLGRTMEFHEKRNQAIQALTPADIQRVIGKHFQPGAMVKITAGDAKKMTSP